MRVLTFALVACMAILGCSYDPRTGKRVVTVEGCISDAETAHLGTKAFVCKKLETDADIQDCYDSADAALALAKINCRRWATPEADLVPGAPAEGL